MTQATVVVLCGAGLLLGVIAVVIDRLNFPQRRFTAKGVRVGKLGGATRDRTGAHIIDLEDPNKQA